MDPNPSFRAFRSALVYALGALLATFAAGPAAATTYVPMADADLAAEAAVIVRIEVVEVGPGPAGTVPTTDYRMVVERVLQGEPGGGELTVRVPGGVTVDGIGWDVEGAPRFAVGERALLFLAPRPDGAWGVLQLPLGAFHEVEAAGRLLALRDLSGATRAGVAGSPPEEPVRDADAFADWLADRAAGFDRPADYRVDLSAEELARAAARFALFDDQGQCGGSRLHLRWFRFDDGQDAAWVAREGGQPGMTGGGFSELGNALAAWNADPGSHIRYTYGGTTAGTTVPAGAQGILVFDDPAGEISGSFSCSKGGTLAIGGPSFLCTSQTYQGVAYRVVAGGRVVTQDGAGCHFAGHGGKDGEEVFAHELGHTLGLDHSTVPGALMRATAYGDGRGASLGSDDRAAIATLYGDGTPVSTPAVPSNLRATALSQTSVRLAWNDNAGNEDEVRIEGRSGGSFQALGSVAANTTQVTIGALSPGTAYTFRVRACNVAGCSPYSNEAGATTPSPVPSLPVAPSALEAILVSSSAVELAWRDNSSDEETFRLERRTGSFGSFAEVATLAAGTNGTVASGLQPATDYGFRVRACNAAGCSPYSNEVVVTTPASPPPPGDCPTDGSVLCLLGGRFRVDVDWFDPRSGDRGRGTAIPDSANSGFFWFFSPDNVELVVKLLDGRSVNGHFWVFYGALSDVEYDIEVTDLEASEVARYHNPAGRICGQGDIAAFPRDLQEGALASPTTAAGVVLPVLVAAPSVASGSCRADAETLCLENGRFAVRVDWTDQHNGDRQGNGRAVPGTDESGYFWFFSPANVELVVKVLDGRPVNGHFWFFSGALTDVGYTIRVTDTTTGEVVPFVNVPGNLCGRADLSAL